ncbi:MULTISPECIES: DoxX family protein [unclassified Streptomyces]|uniref:DoxX family protein n=1 Tax=unclassified Streptomyces TaxID=2593676 RepID=UPI00119D523F|nr:DoxX family protein [Streptomyces sp. BK340]TVZ93292.1 DoxX-like protein [Streptomyces sp. BK340]
MNIALWITAALLAVGSLAGGAMLLIRSRQQLATSGWAWVEDFGDGTVKVIGALKVLAAAGLILPAALHVAPVLVPLAAVGWVLLMTGAVITHLRRQEAQAVAVNLVLLALAAFVAWGRFGPHSFTG